MIGAIYYIIVERCSS